MNESSSPKQAKSFQSTTMIGFLLKHLPLLVWVSTLLWAVFLFHSMLTIKAFCLTKGSLVSWNQEIAFQLSVLTGAFAIGGAAGLVFAKHTYGNTSRMPLFYLVIPLACGVIAWYFTQKLAIVDFWHHSLCHICLNQCSSWPCGVSRLLSLLMTFTALICAAVRIRQTSRQQDS